MGHWGKLKQNHFEHEVKTIKHTYIKTSRNSILGKFIRDICISFTFVLFRELFQNLVFEYSESGFHCR